MNKYSDLSLRKSLLKSSKKLTGNTSDDSLRNSILSYSPIINNLLLSPSPPEANHRFYLSKSPGISSITSFHNKELNEKSKKLEIPKSSVLKFPLVISKYPSEKNFTDLLAKINNIASPKDKAAITLLKKSNPIYQTQLPRTSQYYKIHTLGKKPPLSVSIKKYSGKITIYCSYTKNYPNSANHDLFFNEEYFEITTNSFEFKEKEVYISVYSENECSYKLEVYFGKPQNLQSLKTQSTQLNIIKRSEEDEMLRNTMKNTDKDFIKANMDIRSYSFANKNTGLKRRVGRWDDKIERVMEKKKNFMQEKKIKAIEFINKKIRKLEKEALAKEESQKLREIQKMQKNWIFLIVFVKFNNLIRDLIKKKREDILTRVQTNLKVRLIQAVYKNQMSFLNISPSLVLAQRTLSLYHNVLSSFFKYTSIQKIIKSIHTSAKSNIIAYQIGNFRLKIVLIQRKYKLYLLTKKSRLKILKTKWKKCIDKILFIKRLKSKLREKVTYEVIPITTRNQILQDYYDERWKIFRIDVRNYIKSKLSTGNGPIIKLPVFDYIPTNTYMIQLIQKSIKNNDKN
jgi:hypothetical protein